MVISTRRASGTAPQTGSSDTSRVKTRLVGKKPSQMVTACFHRGGAAGAPPGSSARSRSDEAGTSNQPSMPVRRSTRASWTNSSPLRSHQCRSAEDSQAASEPASAKR